MVETFDVVVVGAGWFGLAAAKAYVERHPTDKIAIYESAESCGGTWAQSRLYPGLKSNNMIGTYEYPGFPMSEDKYGVKPFTHIPAATLHRYLTDFAKSFGLLDKIQFDTTVTMVQPSKSGGWQLSLTNANGTSMVETAKLILATGLTSAPNMPQYPKSDTFGAPLFHAKDFCKQAPHLKDVKNAVVVGAGKSAFDVTYAMVESGATVDLVIRPDGKGPVWIAPALVTPLKKRLDQLLNVRFMTWFAPCPWGGEDGYPGIRRFLHGTAMGRVIVNIFWKVLGSDVIAANGYDSDPRLHNLKPWHSAFWTGSGLSILNFDTNIFDMVKDGKIRVHIDNIDHLEPHTVVLKSGKSLEADAIICSTGWKKESSLKFAGLGEEQFGLPYSEATKRELAKQADAKVLQMFPRLANPPDFGVDAKEAEPLRLYRFMVPSTMMEKRNLAFAGMVSCVTTSIVATVQAQWIVTFFDGKLDRVAKTQQEVTDEIMLHTQWGKWRFPCGYGAKLPDMAFEGLPYINLLMNDMKLSVRRKASLIAELTYPYIPQDFVGLSEEWKSKHA
ncbi:hypothetical protein PV10_01964 [Exophiala mesophila]|uniref:FAD/NAD(P)-binding domain-containing protein n=1 Tax=Exophiala mesophila TaxID=212818 RepID=A0A0D1WXM8_EXOME|nr:uncharacterized protein PV10_01964 [Exophiala mesophila]KIV94175.1 hypothetical protein PV10_01964 [Exophiala mesophila]